MYIIVFLLPWDAEEERYPDAHPIIISSMGDKAIDNARDKAIARHGKLEINDRTDYPSFTIYDRHGDEIGGN
jgi:hypothetical protein